MPGRGQPWKKGGLVDFTIELADMVQSLQDQITGGGGGNGQSILGVMFAYVNFGGAQPRFYAVQGSNDAGGVVSHSAQLESDQGFSCNVPFTWKSIRLKIDVNNVTGSTSHTSRINGVDGNQVINVPTASTGEFTDLTNTDAIIIGDEINMKYLTTSGAGVGTVKSLFSLAVF